MTLTTLRSPFPLARAALSFFLFIAFISIGPTTGWAKGKRAAAPAAAPKRAAREDRKRDRGGREKSAKESRADRQREERGAKGGRAMSRREKLAEARRLAEERRREMEEARRRAEEARRRAEAARLAAIARQRAIEQAMRDEVAANILKDDPTGEDLEVRRAAVAALGNHIGTVVVMNPKDGRVLSIVNQDWAVRRGFKPCSTIKLVTGLAGISEKVISPVETVDVSNVSYRLDLTDALAYSNNGYFQNVGGQVGFDRMISYARQLGLGERTGINHVNEYAGRVPVFKSGWAVNRMSSHGDDFEVTPIQLANLASAIANGGELLVPHLPRTPQENFQFKKEVRRQLTIPHEAWQRMIPGMIGSVSYGSGKKAYDPYQTIAGKTGTCIGQDHGWLGLFTSYAPVYDPQMAIAVVMKGPDARGHVAAAVAGNIYKALNHRFGNVPPSQMAKTPLVPRPKINAKAAAAISDEEKDEGEAETAGVDGVDATDTAAGAAEKSGGVTRQGTVKSTIMTYPSKGSTESMRPAPAMTPQPQQAAPNGGRQMDGRPRRVLPAQP